MSIWQTRQGVDSSTRCGRYNVHHPLPKDVGARGLSLLVRDHPFSTYARGEGEGVWECVQNRTRRRGGGHIKAYVPMKFF